MKDFIGKVAGSFVTRIKGDGAETPCCSDMIYDYEKEVKEAGEHTPDESKHESILKLGWALVHSSQPEDVNRGLTMLEEFLAGELSTRTRRDTLYLVSVGYYKCGDYESSLPKLTLCLEIAPDFRQALTLKKNILVDRTFCGSVFPFFIEKDQIPCYRDMILDCERDIAEELDEVKYESITKLVWALVHSRQPEDVKRGIDIFEDYVGVIWCPHQRTELFYLLAVGYYRSGNNMFSWQCLDMCLEITPDFRQASTLMKMVENQMYRDYRLGRFIASVSISLVAGGLAMIAVRRRER